MNYRTEAERVIGSVDMGRVGGGERLIDAVAAALEAAEKRGRVAGLREAAERVNRQLNHVHPMDGCETCRAFDDIERRAEEVERA